MKSGNRDLELVRKNNRVLVSMAVRLHGPISRIELAQLTGLSSTSIGRVVDELIRENEFVEVGQTSGPRGRPKSLLDINKDACVIAGIRIGPESIQLCIADYKCDILSNRSFSYDSDGGCIETVVNDIHSILYKLLQASDFDIQHLIGVGVAVAGLADPIQGIISKLTNRRGWEVADFANLLQMKLKCPVIVDNDIRAVALTSHLTKDARVYGSTLYVHICEGIGAAYIGRDKSLLRGSHNAAGLIGHTKVMADGPICGCGGSGCLETLASDIAFIRRIWPEKSADPAEYSESERIELVAEGVRMAQNQEPAALEAFQSIADYLGTGIGNAIMIMDPDAVVISGTMIDCAPMFAMDIIRKAILQCVWRECQGVQIMPHIGSQNSVLKGALGLVICQPYFTLQRENTASRSISRFCLPDL